MFAFFKSLMHRIVHRLVFKGSVTSGGLEFYGFGEVPESPIDGRVIIYDSRFKSEHICGYRFENRHVTHCSPQVKCLAIWHELMSIDGVRPIALIDGELIRTPYGPAQPMPRRFKKLFEIEQERLKRAAVEDAYVL